MMREYKETMKYTLVGFTNPVCKKLYCGEQEVFILLNTKFVRLIQAAARHHNKN
jgi:hypothetical protein